MAEAYGNLIQAALDDELSAAKDFRARALTVVTTSTGLATLITAVATLPDPEGTPIRGGAQVFLIAGIGLFILAAVLALVINAPATEERPDPNELQRLIDEHWNEADADQAAANLKVKLLRSVQDKNEMRTTLLRFAVSAEILAVFALGLMALLVVVDG